MTRAFYVSVIRSPTRRALLAGPFASHESALAVVDAARRAACTIDPWCDFDAFGTCAIVGENLPAGKLNATLGVQP